MKRLHEYCTGKLHVSYQSNCSFLLQFFYLHLHTCTLCKDLKYFNFHLKIFFNFHLKKYSSIYIFQIIFKSKNHNNCKPMKYPKIKLELSFLNSEFRVLHYVQFHWNITNKTMSHQVQQMNHYTKKLSHFEAWQMLTYKPVTTTITVIITFRKQKLCSTLKMVSLDLVFPCFFFHFTNAFFFF